MPIDLPPQPIAAAATTTSNATAAQSAAPNVANFRPIALRASSVGHFHLRGTLNGVAVEVLIDTGASATVADRGWAEAQGLPLVPIENSGGGVGGAGLSLSRIEGAKLSIGGIDLPGVGVVAIDLGNVARQLQARGATPPQVVIGVDVLRRWRAVIDYATSTLWLAPTPG